MIVRNNKHNHRLSAFAMAAAPSTPHDHVHMTELFGDSPGATNGSSGAITVASTSPPNRGGGIPTSSDDELARAIADVPPQSSLMVHQVATTMIQPHPAKRRAVQSPGDYEEVHDQARQIEALRELLQAT